MKREMRQAWRAMRSSLGLSAVTAITLALGIGANAGVFSVAIHLFRHPLPVADIERLVVVNDEIPRLNVYHGALPAGELLDLQSQSGLFTGIAGTTTSDRDWATAGGAVRARVSATLGPFFSVLGVTPAVGAFYNPDASRGDQHVVVIGYHLWQQAFGGSRDVIGREIKLDSTRYRIVGVGPASLRYPWLVDMWVPEVLAEGSPAMRDRGALKYASIARLRDGISLPALTSALRRITDEWSRQYGSDWYPESYKRRLTVTTLVDDISATLSPAMLLVGAGVVIVFIMACVNLTAIQLVRSASRNREASVRAALGASLSTLVRERLAELALVVLLGTVLAAGVAIGIISMFSNLASATLPSAADIPISWSLVSILAAFTVLTITCLAVAPIANAIRINPMAALRSGADRTSSMRRHDAWLLEATVCVQFALSMTLLFGGLVVSSDFRQLISTDPGFRVQDVAIIRMSASAVNYPNSAARLALEHEILSRVGSVPGVRRAGVVFGLPFSGQGTGSIVHIPGRDVAGGAGDTHAALSFVGGDYFAAMGIPLKSGRDFGPGDIAGHPPVAIIDDAFARGTFPGEQPIGRRLTVNGMTAEVIGVVAAVRKNDLAAPPDPTIYLSYEQLPGALREFSLVALGKFDQGQVGSLFRGAIGDVARNVRIDDVTYIGELIRRSIAPKLFSTYVVASFAIVSLLLAVSGIYGVIRYTAQQRTREIAIRLAIGADQLDVAKLIVQRTAAMVAFGIAGGIAGCLLTQRAWGGLIPNVGSSAVREGLLAVGILVSAAAVAVWLPSRRAMRTSPSIVLREG